MRKRRGTTKVERSRKMKETRSEAMNVKEKVREERTRH